MKNICRIFLIVFLCLAIASCEYGSPLYRYSEIPVDKRAVSIAEMQAPQIEPNSKYSFLVVTDTHFGTEKTNRAEEAFLQKFEELLSNSDPGLRPRFIVNMGDTLNAGRKKEADEFNKTAQTWIEKAKTVLGVSDYKIYSILGNHDLYNNGWKIWKENIWPYTSYYKFSLEEFDFYFLDSGNGVLGQAQFNDLEKSLSENNTRQKLVFCHYPIYAGGQLYFTMGDSVERNKMIAIFAKHNVKYYFSGHVHKCNDITDFKNFKEVVQESYGFQKKIALVTIDNTSLEYKVYEY